MNEKEAMRWFKQGEKDLESAKDSLKTSHYEWACYQAQQAAEKCLKAILYAKGVRAILTHSIKDLLRKVSKYQKDFLELLEYGTFLDAFYLTTRYPNALVGESIPAEYYSREDAQKCINYAELILQKVRDYLMS